MKNAKDFKTGPTSLLLMGPTGSGKTSQFLTLPGRKFMFIFDYNALATLQGKDVDYETYFPDVLSMDPIKLNKGATASKHKGIPPHALDDFNTSFDEKMETNFFDQYDVIGMDSLSLFQSIVMDSIAHMQGRAGKWPEMDDWTIAIQQITSSFRNLHAQTVMEGKILFVTAHTEFKQDERTKRFKDMPVMIGQMKTRLPLLFSEVLRMRCESDEGEEKFTAQTRPDDENDTIRTTIKDLSMFEDVTIDWKKDPVGQGIGGLITRSN